MSDAVDAHPLSHNPEVWHTPRAHPAEAVGDDRARAYGGAMSDTDNPTPADLELDDALRSIRSVGEDAGRGSTDEPDDSDDTEPGDDTTR